MHARVSHVPMHTHLWYYPKVKMPPSGRIDRDAIDLNEEVLKPVIVHLGARVGVDVLETHLMSLYEMMALPLSSISPIASSYMHCM